MFLLLLFVGILRISILLVNSDWSCGFGAKDAMSTVCDRTLAERQALGPGSLAHPFRLADATRTVQDLMKNAADVSVRGERGRKACGDRRERRNFV